MKLSTCRFLADENIEAGVVAHLRALGCDVVTVLELGLGGQPDTRVLSVAATDSRVVLTHDSDFGQLAIRDRASVYGIVFLRPGHLSIDFTIGTIAALWRDAPDLRAPFILVAARTGDDVSIRVRFLDLDSSPGSKP